MYKKKILNQLRYLTNKLFILCIYPEYELFVDIFESYTNDIIIFPVYLLNDYYNIFHSLIHSGLSTTVDFYIILADDNELNYFIDNIVELAFLSQSHMEINYHIKRLKKTFIVFLMIYL